MRYFENHDLKQIENLELLANQVVEGFIIGLHKSPFHGFSVEFAEHRLYNKGESTKHLDWKLYARTDKMFVKRYEEETNLRCQIVIDTSSSMYYPKIEESINKLQFSALAAASLMNLLKKQRDAFGLSLFDDHVHTISKCKTSTTHYRLMLSHLDDLIHDKKEHKSTAAATALHQIADQIDRRSLVIIFSDLFDDGAQKEALYSALQHLRYAKHEVVLFHVLHKRHEIDFDFQNKSYHFEDLETGQVVKLNAGQVKDIYSKKVKAIKEELKTTCLQYKIDYMEADIEEGFYPVLQELLHKKKQNAVMCCLDPFRWFQQKKQSIK